MTNLWPSPLDPASEAFAREQDRFVRRHAFVLLAICLFSILMGLSVGEVEDVQAIDVVQRN